MFNLKKIWCAVVLVSVMFNWNCSKRSATGPEEASGPWTIYTTADGLPGGSAAAIALESNDAFWYVPIVEGGMGIVHFDGSSWKPYTTNNGMCSNTIIWFEHTLALSSDGILWVGTFGGGVARFDGQTWTSYTTADGLLSNDVSGVAIAPNGDLWSAHPASGVRGLSRFDGETWTVYRESELGVSYCNLINIVFDPDGTLWAGGSHVVLRFRNGTWTSFSTETGLDLPVALYMDAGSDGKIWIGGGDGVSCFDGRSWTPFSFEEMGGNTGDVEFLPLAVDFENVLWAGVPGQGVFQYDGNEWNKFNSEGGPALLDVMSITIGPDGAVWFGTETGISRYKPENGNS
ncbi:hypothetical protein JW948_00675 [bacterium]|nr:hypothetical protein [bacterium]